MMRYGTKWIGLEDDDPFAEHFTEDVVLTPHDENSTDDDAVREYSIYWIDDEGDVIMDD